MKKMVSSQIRLDGTEKLHVIITIQKIQGKLEVSHEVHEKDFFLTEVTSEDLLVLRGNSKPGFVLKQNNKLYYTQIPSYLRFFSQPLLGHHICSRGASCKRLTAASDDEGGCAKVRDLVPEKVISKNSPDYIKNLQRIEKYDFITCGYESFNCRFDCLVVVSCNNYQKDTRKVSSKKGLSPSY